MRMLFSIIALCFCVCISYNAEAAVSYHNTHLVNNIKPNLTFRSKPTSNYIKLASVQFLGGARKELNYGCPGGQGWRFDEEAGCVPKSCDDFPYVAGSPELEMCAIGADDKPQVESCLSGTSQRLRCRTCKPPSVFNDDKECVCDRSTYVTDTCPDNTVFITPEDSCTEISSTGVEKTYYKGCDCPEGWYECTDNQVGSGTGCTTSEGKVLYSSCRCNSSFSETCASSGVEPSGEGCTDNYGTWYKACVSCDITKGTVANKDEYWCNYDNQNEWHPWITITPMSDAYNTWSN